MYKIDYHKRVIKFLEKQDLEFKNQVFDTFDKISLDLHTSEFDVKPFKTSANNKYRLRIEKYRFIYEIFNSQLLIKVVDGGSRGDIYK